MKSKAFHALPEKGRAGHKGLRAGHGDEEDKQKQGIKKGDMILQGNRSNPSCQECLRAKLGKSKTIESKDKDLQLVSLLGQSVHSLSVS